MKRDLELQNISIREFLDFFVKRVLEFEIPLPEGFLNLFGKRDLELQNISVREFLNFFVKRVLEFENTFVRRFLEGFCETRT